MNTSSGNESPATLPSVSATESDDKWRNLLAELVRTIPHRPAESSIDAPGHCHRVPGVWDMDNHADKAGKPCEWCKAWRDAREALQSSKFPGA